MGLGFRVVGLGFRVPGSASLGLSVYKGYLLLRNLNRSKLRTVVTCFLHHDDLA